MPKKATSLLLDSLKGEATPPLTPYLGRKKRWVKKNEGKSSEQKK